MCKAGVRKRSSPTTRDQRTCIVTFVSAAAAGVGPWLEVSLGWKGHGLAALALCWHLQSHRAGCPRQLRIYTLRGVLDIRLRLVFMALVPRLLPGHGTRRGGHHREPPAAPDPARTSAGRRPG